MSIRPGSRSALVAGLSATIVFALACASIAWTRGTAPVAPFWPCNAVGLVLLLRLSRSRVDEAAMLIAIAAAGGLAFFLTGAPAGAAIVLGFDNAAEIALSVFLARRFATTRFHSVAQGWRFFAMAGPPAAAMGAAVMGAVGLATGAPEPWVGASLWGASHLLCFVLIGPVGMTISAGEVAKLNLGGRWREALAVAVSILTVTLGVFLQSALPLLFVVTPFLLLATFRFGLIGANAAVLTAAVIAIPLTYAGRGPLALAHLDMPGARLILLQAFLAINGLTAVPIAAALGELRHVSRLAKRREEELAGLNRDLLQTVISAEFAERVGGMGYWRIATPSLEMTWSSGMFEMFNRDPQLGPLRAQEIAERYAVEGAEGLHGVADALERRCGLEFEFAIALRDGARRHLVVRARFVEQEGGAGMLMGVVRDVTEDRVREARYRLLTENANDLVTEMNTAGDFTYVSPSVREMTGYAVDEVVGRSAMTFIHPEDRERVGAVFRGALKGPSGWQIEYRAICKDGRTIWVEARPTLLRDPVTGQPRGVTDVIRDITSRKAVETALSSSEARYRLLAENATDMISRYGLDGVIQYVSPACLDVLGFTPEELVGKVTLDLIHPDDVQRIRAQFAAYLAAPPGTPPIQTEHRATRRDGRTIWLEGRPIAIRDADGVLIGYQDVMRDITGRKAMEAELEQARVEAEAAARAKDDFLANMSHELRTPLNSIVGFSGLIAQAEELRPETRRRVELVHDASRSLVSIVNDVLDLSKIEAEGLDLDPSPVDLERLLEQAADLVREEARRKNLSLEIEVSRLFAPILADPVRLRQVVLNLLGNAVKFTAQGRVVLSLSETSQGHVRIAVRDTGVGIPPDRLGAIFDRFAQADESTSRRFGGTGLGLAISRSIVQAMGGEIGVESRSGVGSTFWFTFDPTPADMLPSLEAPAGAEPCDARGLRVLLADDNDVNRDLFQALLAPHALDITEVADGAQAVAAFDDATFDIVFMDVQMPVMDGMEATRTLRARGVETPIIALTANIMVSQVETYRQAGMTDHLSKPYDVADVLRLIAAHVDARSAGRADAAATVSSATLEGLRASLGAEALDRFVLRLAEQLHEMSALLSGQASSPVELAERAHGVRGLAGTLGFGDINQSYSALESRCRDGLDAAAEVSRASEATRAALSEIDRMLAA